MYKLVHMKCHKKGNIVLLRSVQEYIHIVLTTHCKYIHLPKPAFRTANTVVMMALQ